MVHRIKTDGFNLKISKHFRDYPILKARYDKKNSESSKSCRPSSDLCLMPIVDMNCVSDVIVSLQKNLGFRGVSFGGTCGVCLRYDKRYDKKNSESSKSCRPSSDLCLMPIVDMNCVSDVIVSSQKNLGFRGV